MKIWSLNLKDFRKKCKTKAQAMKFKIIFLQKILKSKQMPALQIHDQASWRTSQNQNWRQKIFHLLRVKWTRLRKSHNKKKNKIQWMIKITRKQYLYTRPSNKRYKNHFRSIRKKDKIQKIMSKNKIPMIKTCQLLK